MTGRPQRLSDSWRAPAFVRRHARLSARGAGASAWPAALDRPHGHSRHALLRRGARRRLRRTGSGWVSDCETARAPVGSRAAGRARSSLLRDPHPRGSGSRASAGPASAWRGRGPACESRGAKVDPLLDPVRDCIVGQVGALRDVRVDVQGVLAGGRACGAVRGVLTHHHRRRGRDVPGARFLRPPQAVAQVLRPDGYRCWICASWARQCRPHRAGARRRQRRPGQPARRALVRQPPPRLTAPLIIAFDHLVVQKDGLRDGPVRPADRPQGRVRLRRSRPDSPPATADATASTTCGARSSTRRSSAPTSCWRPATSVRSRGARRTRCGARSPRSWPSSTCRHGGRCISSATPTRR
jgi:hypothetical protein